MKPPQKIPELLCLRATATDAASFQRVIRSTAALLLIVAFAACRPAAEKGQESSATNVPAQPLNNTNDPSGTNLPSAEVEIDVDKASEHLIRGNEFLAQGKTREAIAEFELAVKFNPDDEDSYYNLALALARAGDTESAKKHYLKSLEIYPDYIEAHNNLGNILVSEGKFAEAIDHFQKALANDDKNASTHNNLGTAYARQKKIAHSLTHFETAVQLQPDYPDAQFNLGNAYLLLGRVDEAIDQYNTLLQFHPEFQRARVQLEKARAIQSGAAAPNR